MMGNTLRIQKQVWGYNGANGEEDIPNQALELLIAHVIFEEPFGVA